MHRLRASCVLAVRQLCASYVPACASCASTREQIFKVLLLNSSIEPQAETHLEMQHEGVHYEACDLRALAPRAMASTQSPHPRTHRQPYNATLCVTRNPTIEHASKSPLSSEGG